MKRILSAIALSLACGPALAADLYVPAMPDAMVTSSGYDWSGFYLGAALGGQNVLISAPGQGSLQGTAVVGGVFAGANGQSGNFVYGAEMDVEYSGFNASRACTNAAWTCNGYVNWQGSLRGRLGFAVDTILIYGTAGLALANVGGSTVSPANVSFPDSSVRAGFTVGAGVEAAFNENWFGRVEYRYTNFGARDMTFDVVYPGVEASSHAIRAGVGYKF